MRVTCLHPVPVRWRPPRSQRDRHAFLGLRTPVDIPEVESPPPTFGIHTPKGTQTCYVHGGVAYDMMTEADLIATSTSSVPIRPEALANHLGACREAPGRAFRQGTPLRAATPDAAAGSGSELPRSVLQRAGEDHAEAARTALARHVARTFLVDGSRVYARRPLPVIAPHDFPDKQPSRAPDILGRRAYGIHFEPARFPEMVSYLKRMGYRGYQSKPEEMTVGFHRDFDVPSAIRYGDDDLALWVNGAPALVEAMHLGALDLADKYGDDFPSITPPVERLRRFADLGLVGAIDPADHGTVTELLGDAIDALRAAIPMNHPQPPLNWLKAYSDVVARPLLVAKPAAEADLDDLIGLLPGGLAR